MPTKKWLGVLGMLALLGGGRTHPSPRVRPRPSAECDALGSVTFWSYHVHVVFDDHNASSRAAALSLQRTFAAAFNISAAVDPVACDDTNTTHGSSPGLCMIDND